MRNFKSFCSFSVAITTLSFTSLSQAQNSVPKNQDTSISSKSKKDHMEKLGLTQEQKQKIKQIFANNKSDINNARKNLQEKMQLFKIIFSSKAATDSQVTTAYQAVHSAQVQAANIHLKIMLAVRQILNPEQRNKFIDMERHHIKAMMDGKGPKYMDDNKKQD